jgi:methylaspartate ammonia-lyase
MMAGGADQLLAKPRMGADAGPSAVRNEIATVPALAT